MNEIERKFLLEQLTTSEAHVRNSLQNLKPPQWTFQETPQRWSIAENVEHLVLFERFIRSIIAKILIAPADPDKSTAIKEKEPLVMGLATGRDAKIETRDIVRPSGRWTDIEALLSAFHNARSETILFATETQADLRHHFFPHLTLGDLDAYQWLLVLAQHAERHVLQIEEIKASKNYPHL